MKVVLENLTKIFPNRDKKKSDVIAVNDFSIEIPDGKLVALLGPSGCGKSTALFMICGLHEPTSGRVYFGNEDVTDVPVEDRGVGVVFQNYALYPHLTVRQNIMFPLENMKKKYNLTKDEMELKTIEAARIVSIEEYLDRKPSELSGGQQQRVAIARAIVKRPKILLLDEPLSNLDARLRLQTREEIRRIQRETNITTVFVTHDQEEAMSISDMIIVMKDGVLHQYGRPQDVYDKPINLFVAKFLGTPAINIFNGKIADGKVCIGEFVIYDSVDITDRDVYVGIRPEGFIVDENGPLKCVPVRVEVMGRDISIISTNENCENVSVRSILSSEIKIDPDDKEIRFSLKKNKVFLFDKETEERLEF